MTLEELKKIPETEWEQASLAALRFLQRRYGLTLNAMVSKGKTIEDIVYESISDLIAGKRKFNPEKNLCENLCLIAKSKSNCLFSSSDHKKCISVDLSDEEHTHMEEKNQLFYESSPKIDNDLFLQKLNNEIANDEELEFMLMAIWDEGETKPSKIAEITGFDIKRVYELRRKLGDKARKVQKEILSRKKSISQVGK